MQREENRDDICILEAPEYYLFLVFDGVSSYENCLEGIHKIKKIIKQNHRAYYENGVYNLRLAIYDMHYVLTSSDLPGMYTTIAALFVSRTIAGSVLYSSVGDTRIYTYNESILNQITHDDNIARLPNILTKCLGLKKMNDKDFYEQSIDVGSVKGIIICTDGFYTTLDESQITDLLQIFSEHGADSVKEEIRKKINLANQDDATYLIILL